MKWFFYMIKILLYIPVRIIYPTKVIGKKRLPKGNYVSITNHLGAKDVVMLGYYLSGFRYYLAKKELENKKFVGWFFKMLGAIYIDRHNMDLKGIKTSINSLKKAPLAIFPEGTRNHEGDQLQQVKGGAAMISVKANATIVPIMIYRRVKAFRRNYVFIGQPFNLPYTSKDRFNTEAMEVSTAIITQDMLSAKESLDILIETKTYKQYDKDLKREYKAAKKALKYQQKELIESGENSDENNTSNTTSETNKTGGEGNID